MRRIEEKIRKKQTHVLTPKSKPGKEERPTAEVIDLMAVLKKSLESRGQPLRSRGQVAASRGQPADDSPAKTTGRRSSGQRSRRSSSSRSRSSQRA
jgi:DNA end-binding protein Ku